MALVNLRSGVWFVDELLRLPGGLRFPTRGALFALGDGSLMLISPPARISEVAGDVRAIGPVSAIVEPSVNHHVGLAAARAAFPRARAFGPPGLGRKLRGQPPVEPLPEGAGAPWVGTVETLPVDGIPRLAPAEPALPAPERRAGSLRAVAHRAVDGDGPERPATHGGSPPGAPAVPAPPGAWRSGGGGRDPGPGGRLRPPRRVLASGAP